MLRMTKSKFNIEIRKLARMQKKSIDNIKRSIDIKIRKLQKQYRMDNK